MTEDSNQRTERAERDIRLSALMGPLRILTTTASSLIIYPVILSRSGIEVLGLWGFIAAIVMYMNLTNVGFSPLLIRKVSQSNNPEGLREARTDFLVARRFYLVVTVLLFVLGAVLLVWVYPWLPDVYPRGLLVCSVAVLVAATCIRLISQLVDAVLSGIHETYAIHTISAVLPLVRFSFGLTGALLRHPIEGFTLGILFENSLRLIVGRWWLGRKLPEWPGIRPVLRGAASWKRTVSLMKEGWQLYSLSLGFMLREPIFRGVITFTLGLAAAGVYDLAMRIPQAFRSLITAGSTSFFPSFSHMYASKEHERLQKVIQRINSLLIIAGVTILGCYWVGADLLLELWLPKVPDGVVTATRIFTIWCSITLLNVPYWYLLQATNHERVAARALWLHTLCIIALIPASLIVEFDLHSLLIYWTATALLAQAGIYIAVERLLGLYRSTMIRPKPLLLLGSGLGLVMLAEWLRRTVGLPDANIWVRTLLLVSLYGAACLLLFGHFFWKMLIRSTEGQRDGRGN